VNNVDPVHKLKSKAKVLLTSVFGPYAQNDEYGSRDINPMELYQNQVTRTQGAFSLRMFHRSFGLMLIQNNLDAPTTLLDFPTRQIFIDEIKCKTYDIIGISSITPNIGKVKEMCKLIRQYQPHATIVVGGHIASMSNLENLIDADHIVRGEGVRWFRTYLGQDPSAPIKHPEVYSGFNARILGLGLKEKAGETAAILLPSVGCPMGCNFCSTSALFGGKGNSIHFYETGDELFEVMCQLEKNLKVKSFFALDENFLFYRKRALRLLELMEKHSKSWALYVFSSAKVLRSYSMEQLVGLGVSWVWMGLEGKNSQYAKLGDIDTKELVRDLQDNGIRVLGSSIIGMEDHTPENISQVIDDAVSHGTVFHQFMLYTPTNGTPLYREHMEKGTLLSEDEFPVADAHGQYKFNYRHSHIRDGQEEQYLLDAFNRDFEVNGPSLSRMFKTTLNGLRKYKNHPVKRVADRYKWEARNLAYSYAGASWAIRRYFKNDLKLHKELDSLMKEIYREFGWKSRILAPLMGLYISHMIKKEEDRLENGWKYEPPTFYEKNPAAQMLEERLPANDSYAPLTSGKLIPATAE
jgi:radical SAM superfamily enzyme YgiQ (UPF0313 family)